MIPAIKKMRYRTYTRKFQNDDFPLKAGDVSSFKIRNNHMYFFRGRVKLDIFVMYKHNKSLYWHELGKPHVLPQELAEEFETVFFNGKNYRVPKDYDAYLTYHYGDWRTPNQNYNSHIDNAGTLAR